MSDPSILMNLSNTMADAVEKAGASTVLVNARPRFPASGVAFAADLILTANHVVERDEDISVMLPDGSEINASVAGRDPATDLALLRLVSPSAFPAVPASQDPRVGQFVLALGRPSPEGIQASQGIVSTIGGPVRAGRSSLLERYVRTDAIPYPGFSGGPLVDLEGHILGINSSGFARGASLTIPVSVAWRTAEALQQQGHVRRGFLGVRTQPVELPTSLQEKLGRQQEEALMLVGAERGSPAEKAGLMMGDIIAGVGGQPVQDHDDLLSFLANAAGQTLTFDILRGGELKNLPVTVGER